MIINRQKVNNILLFGFLLICLFFPGDPYKVKLVFLGLLFVLNITEFFKPDFSSKFLPVFLIGLAFPVLAMIQSVVLTSDVSSAVSGAYSPVILLLLIPIVRDNLKLKEYTILLLKLMALCTIAIAAADIAHVFDANGNNFIRNSFYQFDMGLMGKSAAYSSYYRIFFKASPLLVLLLDDSITKNKKSCIVIAFAALWFSGTRANVFSALIILFFRYVFWNDSKMSDRARVLLSLGIILVALVNVETITRLISSQMNTSGAVASDEVRTGEFKAYFEVFSNPVKLLFGSGFGSQFYNYGREAVAATSELSYFEIIRCVGLILAIPFFSFVLYPFLSDKVTRSTKLAFISYLVIAATNPLLFSSTAMVMYMFIYEPILRTEPVQQAEELQRNALPLTEQ